jgi:hypothetical protein
MGLLDLLAGSPRRRFARLAVSVARRAPGVRSARHDAEEFAIAIVRADDGSPTWLNLSNVFAEVGDGSRAEQRERLGRLIRIMTAPRPDDGWDVVRPRLRPVPRPQTYGRVGPPGMQPPLARTAQPYLNELVVVDRPEAMEYVTPEQLTRWNVTADEVFAAARANLAEIARRTLDRPWAGDRTMITMLDDGDGYFTSLPLAPHWLAEVEQRMGGPVLAFLPDNNTLLLCPLPDDADPVYDLVEKHFAEAARSLSPVGYRTAGNGRVIAYEVPPGHPHENATRRAEAVLAATEYGTQTEWLAREYQRAGIDVHIGRLLAVVPPDGPAETLAVWADGITTLLPKADLIAFARGDEVAFRVPWRVVAEHVELRPEPLLAPARYQVGGWPAAEVMSRLEEQRAD